MNVRTESSTTPFPRTRTAGPAEVGDSRPRVGPGDRRDHVHPPAADLVTVVVNWNTAELLDDCLHSIVVATPPGVRNQVVVVDNASTDGSVRHLRSAWPEVTVIANDRNVGFCRANNQAIRATDSPYLLLVNTDARLHPDAIAPMLSYFERDPRAAVVGPRLAYADGSFQRWTAGAVPSLRSAAGYLLGLDRLTPGRHGGMFLASDTDTPFRPGWVSSAVMALRREAVEQVGLLDEQIFVYMDDVDLCARVRAAGWTVWYAADTTATHFMGASSGPRDGQSSPEALRALNRWFARHHGRAAAGALRALEVVGFGGRAAVHGMRTVVRPSQRSRAQARLHASRVRLALESPDV